MRHFLNTLFIMSEDNYLTLDGENIVILNGEENKGRFPLHTLECILYFGYKGASPALMGACAERGVSLCFLKPSGRFLARVGGKSKGNVLLRKQQYRISDQEEASCLIAKSFIIGKIFNGRWILERATRDHRLRVDVERLKTASDRMAAALTEAHECIDLDLLRGIEGKAAQEYFAVFDELILHNKEAFYFNTRSRRPPLDNVNALLSFAYTLLAHDCASALESVGLDSYVGFLHRDRPGRESLALDLMEELRGVIAERFVISLINGRSLLPKYFVQKENGAVLLNEDGRKNFLSAWQKRKQETLTHPFLKEKIPWGLVPYVQSLLLARYLRGDLDAYPPFFWK
jgi:CRISPR-associated protein Cas1